MPASSATISRMQASPELMKLAWVMSSIYIGLGLWSLVLAVREFRKPVELVPEKVAAIKKVFSYVARFLFGAVGMAVYAVVTRKYYLLAAAALLASFALPATVRYLRVRAALRSQSAS